VGGAVRDFLLNRQPKDYDLSCGATPEQIRRIFKKRRTLIIGRRFKLVHLFHEREIIEISTFRKRPSATGAEQMRKGKPGRDVPENMIFRDNEYGSSEEDALRRDFTVNASLYDPVNDKIVDYTGLGLSDIHAGIVRTIGDAGLRFQEDPVRVLRALKLVGQYGFSMDDETKASVQDCLDSSSTTSPTRA
jgi:poly(A) polymerase